jgi:hypothetical protein
MLIVKIEGKETIERAVKKLKRKYDNAKRIDKKICQKKRRTKKGNL